MKEAIGKLEEIVTQCLQDISKLNNNLRDKDLDKSDLILNISLDIIDILDSYDRIQERLTERKLDEEELVKMTMGRYEIIKKKLLKILTRFDVEVIEFPDNKMDDLTCEVLKTEINPDKENFEIISIVRKGYKMREKTIRTAQVIVVKNDN